MVEWSLILGLIDITVTVKWYWIGIELVKWLFIGSKVILIAFCGLIGSTGTVKRQ